MKSYKELTGRYLKTQKRTILTIIGIIPLCPNLSHWHTIVSFREVLIEEIIEERGNWYIQFTKVKGDM